MKVRLSRTIQVSAYEPMIFDVTLEESDLQIPEGVPARKKHALMLTEAYKQLVVFLVFNGRMTTEEAKKEVERLGQFYGT